MLADSARALATRYGVMPGRRIVVATSHDGGYRAALDLAEAGCEIVMIVDLPRGGGMGLAAGGARARAAVETHATILGSRGGLRVTHALVARLWSDGRPGKPDDDRLRPHRHDRRLDAERASVLAIARQAALRRRRRGPSCPARRRRRRSASAPAPASSTSPQAR